MARFEESNTLSWGDMIDFDLQAEEQIFPMEWTNSCLKDQSSPCPPQPPATTPDQTQEERPQGDQHHHQAPYQRGEGGHQNQAPYYYSGNPRRPPRWQVEDSLIRQIEELESILQQERELRLSVQEELKDNKIEVAYLEKWVKAERNGLLECEKDNRQLKEQLKHLNPKCNPPQDMSYYSLRTKEELVGIIAAQNIKLSETVSSGPKPHNSNTDPDPDKIHELQGVISLLKHQLQSERTKAKNLYKEREEFRCALLDKESQNVEQVEKLEADKRSLEQEVKVLQEEKALGRGPEEDSNNAAKMKELLDLVSSQSNKLQTENTEEDIQEDTEEDIQEDTEEDIQEDTEEDIQEDTEEDIQEDTEEDIPENTEEDIPENTEEDIPENTEEDIPENTEEDTEEDIQEDTEEDIQEDTQDTDQETSGTTPEMVQESSEMERVSLWRRIKKCLTPKSRRQYKQQRRQTQDHQRQHTPKL